MKKWKCSVCGYIHEGDEPPDKCPVCGADKSKFVEIEPEPEPAAESDVSPESEAAEPETESAENDPSSDSKGKTSRVQKFLESGAYRKISDLISKHHLHPISVHVPNGMLPISVIFTIIALFFGVGVLDTVAFYNFVAVFLTMPVVLFAGYIDWNKRYGGNMTTLFLVKMICGGIVTLTSFIVVVWRIFTPCLVISDSSARLPFLLVHLVMLGAAGIAGYLGGKLVFKD